MKPFSVLLMFSISLCASFCCNEPDDGPNNLFFVENEGLIKVENNDEIFTLNDKITIETEILNNQIDTNENAISLSNLFYNDILNDSHLQHSLTLYKQTGFGTLSAISVLNEDIETNTGVIETSNQFITVRSFYDENSNSFKSRFSITLKETGTFFISDDRLIINNYRGIKISGGIYELGFVEILTSIENSNADGAYQFQVN